MAAGKYPSEPITCRKLGFALFAFFARFRGPSFLSSGQVCWVLSFQTRWLLAVPHAPGVRTRCRLGSRRHSRFGNLRYQARGAPLQTDCEISGPVRVSGLVLEDAFVGRDRKEEELLVRRHRLLQVEVGFKSTFLSGAMVNESSAPMVASPK